MDIALSIVSALGGLAGVWAIVWVLLNFKSKRRGEDAEADKAAADARKAGAEADAAVGDNWRRYAEKLEGKQESNEARLSELSQSVEDFREYIGQLSTHIRSIEIGYCEVYSCEKRKPKLGDYHSQIPQLKCRENCDKIVKK